MAAAGRAMGISPGTARSRYARALGKLRLAYREIDS
ncbi:hypothetical protein ACU6RU_13095 [Microbacterium sp. F1-18]